MDSGRRVIDGWELDTHGEPFLVQARWIVVVPDDVGDGGEAGSRGRISEVVSLPVSTKAAQALRDAHAEYLAKRTPAPPEGT